MVDSSHCFYYYATGAGVVKSFFKKFHTLWRRSKDAKLWKCSCHFSTKLSHVLKSKRWMLIKEFPISMLKCRYYTKLENLVTRLQRPAFNWIINKNPRLGFFFKVQSFLCKMYSLVVVSQKICCCNKCWLVGCSKNLIFCLFLYKKKNPNHSKILSRLV